MLTVYVCLGVYENVRSIIDIVKKKKKKKNLVFQCMCGNDIDGNVDRVMTTTTTTAKSGIRDGSLL